MSNYDDPELRYSSLSEPILVLRSHPHSPTTQQLNIIRYRHRVRNLMQLSDIILYG